MLKTFSAIALAIALPAATFAHAAPTAGSNSAHPNAQTCMNHQNMAATGQMKMDHGQMSGMDMSGMNMPAMDHSKMAAMDGSKMMGGCNASPTAGASSDHAGHSH